MPNTTYSWYAKLKKPSWAPPSWLFGPVWAVLYAIIAVTYAYTAYIYLQGDIGFFVLLPFLLNLAANLAFSPIQFGVRSLPFAALDVVLVWITLVWALVEIYPYASLVSFANIPYLLWVSFATVLQLVITYLNR